MLLREDSQHEAFRAWPVSKQKRPAVFREDFEGHFRLRSNTYSWFQLDYYYLAWDRLTQILMDMFGGRTTRILKTQDRLIKAVGRGQCLVHEVTDDDPESIYYFLMSIHRFGVVDLERLFNARLDGFRVFAEFVHSLRSIRAGNVESVVQAIIDVFAWMHFGYWLDCVVEGFAFRYLRYICSDGSLHNVLRDEAVADVGKAYRVDPRNPNIPPGKFLNLSRQRDKEEFALLERIRSNPEFGAAFARVRPDTVDQLLQRQFPAEFRIIEGWSMKYKLTREDLHVASDTEEYLSLLYRMVEEDSTMPDSMLCTIYQDYLRTHRAAGREPAAVLNDVCRDDPDLYLLCRAYTRAKVARERRIPLGGVTGVEIDSRFQTEATEVHNTAISDMRFRDSVRLQVLKSNYPNLKSVLQVSRLQVALREDGHHLIVPHQRTIARYMRDAAKAFVPRVLKQTDDIFHISTAEFIALFREPDPGFIALSSERRQRLLEAEQQLTRCWSVSKQDFAGVTGDVDTLWDCLVGEPLGVINQYGAIQDKIRALTTDSQLAVDHVPGTNRVAVFAILKRPFTILPSAVMRFEAEVRQSFAVLERQCAAAKLPQTRDAYRREQAMLQERVDHLKRKVQYAGS